MVPPLWSRGTECAFFRPLEAPSNSTLLHRAVPTFFPDASMTGAVCLDTFSAVIRAAICTLLAVVWLPKAFIFMLHSPYAHLFQVRAPASGAWPYRRGTLPGVLRDLRVSAYALTWMLLCGLITLYGRMLDLFGTPLE